MEYIKQPYSFLAASGATNVGDANVNNKNVIYVISLTNEGASAAKCTVADGGSANPRLNFAIEVPGTSTVTVPFVNGLQYIGQLVLTPSAALDILVGLN